MGNFNLGPSWCNNIVTMWRLEAEGSQLSMEGLQRWLAHSRLGRGDGVQNLDQISVFEARFSHEFGSKPGTIISEKCPIVVSLWNELFMIMSRSIHYNGQFYNKFYLFFDRTQQSLPRFCLWKWYRCFHFSFIPQTLQEELDQNQFCMV